MPGRPWPGSRRTATEAGLTEVTWAVTVVKAAIAASQDEHQEMALLLTHAAELERDSLPTRGSRALLPTEEIAAELWLRTYRYDDARRDARATLAARPQRISPHVVLARTAARVQDTAAAAEAWRRILELRATADPDDTIRLEAQRAHGASGRRPTPSGRSRWLPAPSPTHAVGKPGERLSSSTCAVCLALCRARK